MSATHIVMCEGYSIYPVAASDTIEGAEAEVARLQDIEAEDEAEFAKLPNHVRKFGRPSRAYYIVEVRTVTA